MTPIDEMIFTRDVAGLIETMTDRFGIHRYQHDGLGRLTNADHPNAAGTSRGTSPVPDESYTYDLFQAVFDDALEGSTHVITRHRTAAVNLRTQFQCYIEKAGVKPWPLAEAFANSSGFAGDRACGLDR